MVVWNIYTMFCPPVRAIIHSRRLVDYRRVQADKPWYMYNGYFIITLLKILKVAADIVP